MHSRCFLLAVYEIDSDSSPELATVVGRGDADHTSQDGKTEVWKAGLFI